MSLGYARQGRLLRFARARQASEHHHLFPRRRSPRPAQTRATNSPKRRETGLDTTAIKRIRNCSVQPSPRRRALLTHYASVYAREQLTRLPGSKTDQDDLTACARYLAGRAERRCPVCGKPPAEPRHLLLTRLPRPCLPSAKSGGRNS